MGCRKRSLKREVYKHLNICIKKKESSQVTNSYLKELQKQETKPKVSRRKGITKIRAEINKIETKK